MKKTIEYLVTILLLILTIIFWNDIKFIAANIIYDNSTFDDNNYSKSENYDAFTRVNEVTIKNKEDIFNLIYSVIDSGANEFSVICPREYKDCISDVNNITKNENLSFINSFVSPFNNYKKYYVYANGLGKVTIEIEKKYSNEQIEYVNNKLDEIENEIIKENMSTKEKIKVFHDYIVKNTKYDKEAANSDLYTSNTAYELLKNGKAICGGYADTIALYLDRLNLPNIKINSKDHVWNLVYIDNEWLHIDATWDDPTAYEAINHNYFLISTKELALLNDDKHNFYTIFKEAIN